MKLFFLLSTLFVITIIQAQKPQKITELYDYVSINKNGESKIKMQGEIDNNGFVIGEWKHFLKDGTLKYIIDHDNNISREFYKTGELKSIGSFNPDTGEHLGVWITYNRKGEIIAQKNCGNK